MGNAHGKRDGGPPACCRCAFHEAAKANDEIIQQMPLTLRMEDACEDADVVGFNSEGGAMCRLASSTGTCAPMEHAMYVLPLEELFKMTEVEPHESLLRQGILQVLHPAAKRETVVFVSHQWLSFRHPDPNGDQLRVLQGAFRRLLEGHEVSSSWKDYIVTGSRQTMGGWSERLKDAVVWFDYFSVPQSLDVSTSADFLAAVASIPAYVEMTDYFFVLCPVCPHHDLDQMCTYYSWQERGWCRLEAFAQYLTSPDSPVIIIRSEDTLELQTQSDEMFRAPLLGRFSCCAMGHKVRRADGTESEIGCDKERIAWSLSAIVEARAEAALERQDMFWHRWLQAIHPSITLVGWESKARQRSAPAQDSEGDEAAERLAVSEFLAVNNFQGPNDGQDGWTPLRWAAIAGSAQVVKGLLRARADVESPTSAPLHRFCHLKGTTVLGSAMTFCRGAEGRQVLDALVDAKADPMSCTSDFHVLHPPALAAYFGSLDSLAWWLDRFPEWDVGQPEGAFGHSLGALAMERCPPDALIARRLEERGLSFGAMSHLQVSNTMLTCVNGTHDSTDMLRFLRDGGHNQANCRRFPQFPVKALTWAGHVAARCGSTDPLMLHLDLFDGATALHAAVEAGKFEQVQWLLANDADPSIANAKGVTPLQLAEKTHQRAIAAVLADAAREGLGSASAPPSGARLASSSAAGRAPPAAVAGHDAGKKSASL